MKETVNKCSLILEGLHCANCAAKIESGIQKMEGVRTCQLNFVTKKLMLEVDSKKEEDVINESKQFIQQLEPDVRVIQQKDVSSYKEESKYWKIVSRIIGSIILAILATYISTPEWIT